MTITLSLSIDDSVASQLISDAALSLNVRNVTQEEAIAYLKDDIRAHLRQRAISGKAIREREAAETAAQAAISASVAVS